MITMGVSVVDILSQSHWNFDVFLRPPPCCKSNVIYHWLTVKGMLCVWDIVQWISKQRA